MFSRDSLLLKEFFLSYGRMFSNAFEPKSSIPVSGFVISPVTPLREPLIKPCVPYYL